MEPKGEYMYNDEATSAILSAATKTSNVSPMVCPEGHVHLIVEGYEVTLSPDDAEEWVEVLYDAAQEAREVADST